MALILSNLGLDGWKFGDLKPIRGRIMESRFGRQRRRTLVTMGRDKPDHILDPIRRHQLLDVRRMARLAAGLATRRFFHHGLGRIPRIGRRWHRGIRGIDAQSRHQLADKGFQFRDPPFQLGDASVPQSTSGASRYIHVERLATDSPFSCASVQENGVNGYAQQNEIASRDTLTVKGRSVRDDAAVRLHDQTVPEGSAMMMLLGSACRDERQFGPDANKFDIHRPARPHLTFSVGAHFCLGSALARLEGRIALEEILKRFPEWDLDPTNAKLSPTSTVRGWETLPTVVA